MTSDGRGPDFSQYHVSGMRSEDGVSHMQEPDPPTPPTEVAPPPPAPTPAAPTRDAREGRGEMIGLSGGDDSILRIQLAARWAERFGPEHGDTMSAALERFRRAFEYLDAVTHGIEPQPYGE